MPRCMPQRLHRGNRFCETFVQQSMACESSGKQSRRLPPAIAPVSPRFLVRLTEYACLPCAAQPHHVATVKTQRARDETIALIWSLPPPTPSIFQPPRLALPASPRSAASAYPACPTVQQPNDSLKRGQCTANLSPRRGVDSPGQPVATSILPYRLQSDWRGVLHRRPGQRLDRPEELRRKRLTL
jgi:hypothetical protein